MHVIVSLDSGYYSDDFKTILTFILQYQLKPENNSEPFHIWTKHSVFHSKC